MTDTPNRPPLWWAMQDAGSNAPGTPRDAIAAEIRALRDWLVPEPEEPGFTATDEAFAIWEERKDLRALLTAEADRAAELLQQQHPAPVQEEAANPWKDALIDALVCAFLLNEENQSDPRRALHDLISWEVQLARDPLINPPAHPAPVPVSDRLPEPNVKVLAHYFNGLGKGRTICAIWVPAKSRSDDVGDDDDFTEYDEEDDKFYWPEGWYEQIENWEDLGWVKVHEGEVVYWQPLPEWPAMPLPAGEGEE